MGSAAPAFDFGLPLGRAGLRRWLRLLGIACVFALFAVLAGWSGAARAAPRITEYSVPSGSLGRGPRAIAAGPDGALWFAGIFDKIGRITTAGRITEYAIHGAAYDIAAGPDGAMWFTPGNDRGIWRITTTGAVTEVLNGTGCSTFTTGCSVGPIARGPDGAMWFTETPPLGSGGIGRITTGGVVTEFDGSNGITQPTDQITAGPDGAMWFTETGGQIGRITTTGKVTEYPIPAGGSAGYVATGPDGALWFTEGNQNKIGRITTGGRITEYAVPTANSEPLGITAGPDGAMWFTEFAGFPQKIGRITTAGRITEYPIPTASGRPLGITEGPDGAIWFTEVGANKIGRVSFGSSRGGSGVRCVVPKLRGRTLARAKKTLRAAHCAVGTVTKKHSAAQFRGKVLSSRPPAGSKRPPGTKIALVVGK